MYKLAVLLSLAIISSANPSFIHGTVPIAHSISVPAVVPTYGFNFGKVLLAPFQTLDVPAVQNTVDEVPPSTKEIEKSTPVVDNKIESVTLVPPTTTTTAKPEVFIDVRGQIPEVQESISTLPKASPIAFASPAAVTNAVNTLSIVPGYSFVPSAPLVTGYGLNVVSDHSLVANVVPKYTVNLRLESGSEDAPAIEALDSVSVESRKKAPLYTEARVQS